MQDTSAFVCSRFAFCFPSLWCLLGSRLLLAIGCWLLLVVGCPMLAAGGCFLLLTDGLLDAGFRLLAVEHGRPQGGHCHGRSRRGHRGTGHERPSETRKAKGALAIGSHGRPRRRPREAMPGHLPPEAMGDHTRRNEQKAAPRHWLKTLRQLLTLSMPATIPK